MTQGRGETIDVLNARVNFETRAEEFTRGIDGVLDRVDAAMKGFARFETDVHDFGSAMALAFEEPQQPVATLFSLMRAGYEQMRSGNDSFASGLRLTTSALSDFASRSEKIKGLVPILNTVSKVGGVLSTVFSRIRSSMSGAGDSMSAVVTNATQLSSTLRVQSGMWIQNQNAAVSALKAQVSEQNKIAVQHQKRIAQLERLRQATLDQAAAEGVEAQGIGEIDAQLENLNQAFVETVQRGAQLKDQLSTAWRVQLPLMQEARGRLRTLGTEMRHLANEEKKSGKISEQRLASVRQMVAEYGQLIAQIRRSGGAVPEQMVKTFERFKADLGAISERARTTRDSFNEAGEATSLLGRIAQKVFPGLKKQVEEVSATYKRYREESQRSIQTNNQLLQYVSPHGMLNTGMMTMVDNSNLAAKSAQQLSFSFGSLIGFAGALGGALGEMNPAFSAIIIGFSQIADQGLRAFSAIASVAGTASQKAAAAMKILSTSLAGFSLMATGVIVKAGLLGAEVKTLEITMRQIAKNIAKEAGVDINKFADYVENLRDKIVKTGITTKEATVALSQFLRARLPIDQVEQLADAAKNLGVTVADMSSSEVFGRFIQFIQTGNSALLDAIGIAKNAGVMMEEYAKSIGKSSAKQLSSQERQIALINGLLKETATVEGVYEEAMKSAGKQLSSMKRYFEEAILVLGRRFEPTLAQIIATMNKLLKWFNELPASTHDFIAQALKWIAVLGAVTSAVMALAPALKLLIPIIKSLGLTFVQAFPWIAVFVAAIGAAIMIFKALKLAWDRDMGGFQERISNLVAYLKEQFAPVISLVKTAWHAFGADVMMILNTIADIIGRIAGKLTDLFADFAEGASGPIGTLIDVLQGLFLFVHNMFIAIDRLLHGNLKDAGTYLHKAVLNLLTSIAMIFKNWVKSAAVWGWNLIVSWANGISRAAKSIITKLFSGIGKLIGKFLAPHSPPELGPLSHIVEWGRGLMDLFLKSFGLADFGALKDIMAPIRQSLEDAVAAGNLDEKNLNPLTSQIRQQVAELLADFRKTGKVNEEMMDAISAKLGEGGRDITEYVRRLLAHQKALRALEEIQKEYTEAQAAGFVPKELEDKLKNAQEQVDVAKEALDWQQAYLDAQRETVNLQLQQLQLLKEIADKMGKEKEGEEEPEEIKMDLSGLDLSGTEEGTSLLDELTVQLGVTHEEFNKMRDAIDNWLTAPFSEKVQIILNELLKLAQFDFPEGWGEMTLGQQLRYLFDKGIEFLTTNIPIWKEEALTKIREWWTGVVAGLKESAETNPLIASLLEGWETKVQPTLDAIKLWFDTNWPIIQASFATAWTVIKDIFDSVVGVIVGQAWPRLKEAFDGISLQMEKMGVDWPKIWGGILKVIGVVAAAIGVVLTAIIGIVVGVVNGIASGIAAFVSQLDDVIASAELFIEGFKLLFKGNLLAGIISIVGGLVSIMISSFKAVFALIIGLVRGFVTGMVGFFIDLYNRLVGHSIITDMISDIINAFTEVDWLGIGKGIIDGIKQGVIDTASSLWEAAKEVVTGALDAVKEMLGIESPSKVAAEIVGAPIVQGIAEGIRNGTAGLGKAMGASGAAMMRNLAEGMQNYDLAGAFQQQLGGLTAAITGAGPARAAYAYNFGAGSITAEFPNVRTGADAGDVWNRLQDSIYRADAISRFER